MHVAIVSYGYPPLKHVSGTRASRMGIELAKLGMDVAIVCVDWRPETNGASGDETANGVRIRRVDPRAWFPAFDPSVIATEPPSSGRWPILGTARRTLSWGPFEGWARGALAALEGLHAERALDVVWAIHGDDGSHEAACRFHRASGVPWVADFKDPWHIFHTVPSLPLQLFATARRARTAAMFTETCHAQAAADAIFRRPTETIWSGYDAASMQEAPPSRTGREMSLVYIGTISKAQHDARRLARVLGEWHARAPEQRWWLDVYGAHVDFLKTSLASSPAAGRLRLHPFASQAEAFGVMKGADVLVLLPLLPPRANAWRGGGQVGVKELEYMAAGTPVLCLGHLIDELRPVAARCGTVFDSGDLDEAAIAFLQRRYDAFTAGDDPPRRVNPPAVSAFAWPEQGKRLAEVLERAARAR